MSNASYADIAKTLKCAKRILILAHDFPDGDAIGSALAIREILKPQKSDVTITFSNVRPSAWAFLDFFPDLPTVSDLAKETYDVAVVVDSSNPKRLGAQQVLLKQAKTVINIDHHGDNDRFGDLVYVREAAAVGEILFEYMDTQNVPMTRSLAMCLLISIITDTGRFRHNNVHPEIFAMVYELLQFATMEDYRVIVRNLYEEEPLTKMKLIGVVVQNMVMLHDKIAFSYIAEECGMEEGLIDPLLSVEGAEAAVLVRIGGGNIRMSFRAKNTSLNVRDLAGQFGGGGHIHASGATLPLTHFEDQVVEIEKKVSDYFADQYKEKK